MKRIEIYASKSKQIKLLLLSILMLVVSLFAAIIGISSMRQGGFSMIAIFGLIGVLFFGAGFILSIIRLCNSDPVVIIDQDGFIENTSLASVNDEKISWSQVERIENLFIGKESYVSIFLKDTDRFMSQLPAAKSKVVKTNMDLGYGHINISDQQLKGYNTLHLEEIMKEYLENSRKSNI